MQAERVVGRTLPASIGIGILIGALEGLHAAHEACDEAGRTLNVVHRDLSPQNILVGADGVARVLDFGIATAAHRAQHTEDGQIKGKVSYMAPEQIEQNRLDRRTDLFAAGVILWELVTGRRMVEGSSPIQQMVRILQHPPVPPGRVVRGVPKKLDEIAMRALARNPDDRYATAREMATALEAAVRPASARCVGDYVCALAASSLAMRAAALRDAERAELPAAQCRISLVSVPEIDVSEEPSSGVRISGIPRQSAAVVPLVHPRKRRGARAWLVLAVLAAAVSAAVLGASHRAGTRTVPVASTSSAPTLRAGADSAAAPSR
jgi:serine/threonine-protein kinase